MKRYFVLVGLFIALMCGCSNKPSQQDAEKQGQENVEATEQGTVEKETEKKTFTTSNGTYYIDEVIQRCYNIGAQDGAKHKKYNLSYHSSGDGTESGFKGLWTTLYGLPNNDKAREVYNDALKKYIQGYEDGWNF